MFNFENAQNEFQMNAMDMIIKRINQEVFISPIFDNMLAKQRDKINFKVMTELNKILDELEQKFKKIKNINNLGEEYLKESNKKLIELEDYMNKLISELRNSMSKKVDKRIDKLKVQIQRWSAIISSDFLNSQPNRDDKSLNLYEAFVELLDILSSKKGNLSTDNIKILTEFSSCVARGTANFDEKTWNEWKDKIKLDINLGTAKVIFTMLNHLSENTGKSANYITNYLGKPKEDTNKNNSIPIEAKELAIRCMRKIDSMTKDLKKTVSKSNKKLRYPKCNKNKLQDSLNAIYDSLELLIHSNKNNLKNGKIDYKLNQKYINNIKNLKKIRKNSNNLTEYNLYVDKNTSNSINYILHSFSKFGNNEDSHAILESFEKAFNQKYLIFFEF